jgi:hypothetical protein
MGDCAMTDVGMPYVADVARQELRQFLSLADRVGIDSDRRRRFLHMSRDEWHRLMDTLTDNRLPPHPALPTLVRHLGYLTSRLDRAAQVPCA